MTQLRVKNWRQFQHYKDRNPPWIKLHFSMLASADWVVLDDRSRVLAVACMLVASRNEGLIDGSKFGLEYLRRVAYLHQTPDLNPLIECGFLEPASGCKRMLADACGSVSVSVSSSGSIQEETKEVFKKEKANSKLDLSKLPADLSPDVWADFVRMRAAKKKPINTQTAVTRLANRLEQCRAAGFSPDEALGTAVEKGWQSVEVGWLQKDQPAAPKLKMLVDQDA
jgi:hypothetical protein